jgi:ELWxxDGT repeat protein
MDPKKLKEVRPPIKFILSAILLALTLASGSGSVVRARTSLAAYPPAFWVASGVPDSMLPAKDLIYYNYSSYLFKTNGTAAGTTLIKDTGESISNMVYGDGMLYFHTCRYENGQEGEVILVGAKLWRSDGTPSGTYSVLDYGTTHLPDYCPGGTNVAGDFYFLRNYSALWKSDGTTAGTALVKTLNPSGLNYTNELVDLNGTLLFSANDSPDVNHPNWGLWRSDGTEAGTVLVKDLYPDGSPKGSNPENLTVLNGSLYFTANDETSYGLWKSDGTAAGTTLVKYLPNIDWPDMPTDFGEFTLVNDQIFFRVGYSAGHYELWKTDGTAAGTQRVKDMNATGLYLPYIHNITNVGGRVFFYSDDTNGTILWKSDGTGAGTVQVLPVERDHSSAPKCLSNVFGRALLKVKTGWWISDGTTTGTVPLVDLGSEDTNRCENATLHGKLLFGSYYSGLWAIDFRHFINYLPLVLQAQPDPCGEILVNQKVWQGGLTWSCDETEHQVGPTSLKMQAGSYSIVEMYSRLIPVQPNHTYQVSYWVKTDLEINAAELDGRVVASQYNASALEGDGLQENRLDAGFSLGENAGPQQDWIHKTYTFTTSAQTAYVRLRAILGGTTGTVRGTMWVDNVSLSY